MQMSKSRIKLGVYMCAILMMGVIAVSSNLSNIMAAFPEVDPNAVVSSMISSSCFAIIIMSLVTGKLMESIGKKVLMIIGILLWLIGGVVPYFLQSLALMTAARVVFGVGCGMVMSLCPAILVEHIDDPAERGKATGTMSAFQMMGCIFFSIAAGQLAKLGWKIPFFVHLMSLVSLIFCIICIPNTKPAAKTAEGRVKFKPTGMMWIWAAAFLVFMMAGQLYSNVCSSLLEEAGIGGAQEAGYSLALFAAGGAVCGFVFGALQKVFRRFTLTVGCFVLALSYLIMAFAGSLAAALFGGFVCGVAFSICMPCIIAGSANSVGAESGGMAVSIATSSQNIGMTLCSLVIPPIGAAWASAGGGLSANQYSVLVGALIVTVFGIVFIALTKKNRQE